MNGNRKTRNWTTVHKTGQPHLRPNTKYFSNAVSHILDPMLVGSVGAWVRTVVHIYDVLYDKRGLKGTSKSIIYQWI
jgi:hypothetical protein